MALYRVSIKASADKSLDKIPRPVQSRIISKIQLLAEQPRPSGCVKLAGAENLWRVRLGDWRVVYLIDDAVKLVDVRIIAHRRDVYRGL
jgi:mRNA interferase RelE/StbE